MSSITLRSAVVKQKHCKRCRNKWVQSCPSETFVKVARCRGPGSLTIELSGTHGKSTPAFLWCIVSPNSQPMVILSRRKRSVFYDRNGLSFVTEKVCLSRQKWSVFSVHFLHSSVYLRVQEWALLNSGSGSGLFFRQALFRPKHVCSYISFFMPTFCGQKCGPWSRGLNCIH